MGKVKLSTIRPNPDNPRFIRDERFERLKANIEKYPKFLEKRPIVHDAEGIILGGNMRYKALIELGYTEVDSSWLSKVSDYTEDEIKAFTVLDNVGFGQWDNDILANELLTAPDWN